MKITTAPRILEMIRDKIEAAGKTDAEKSGYLEVTLPVWMVQYLFERIEGQENELGYYQQAMDSAYRLAIRS